MFYIFYAHTVNIYVHNYGHLCPRLWTFVDIVKNMLQYMDLHFDLHPSPFVIIALNVCELSG